MRRRISNKEFALAALVISFFLVAFGLKSSHKIHVYLIGDSTVANKPLADNPVKGWGQMLPMYFNDNVVIVNDARNGRSTKSFIDEGLWKKVLEKLHPGDYVFIQFGHNDEKIKDPSRYTAPFKGYKNNLIRFIHETRQKGAFPVLITPVNRRKFNKAGRLVNTHGQYPNAVRLVAKQENVPFIDLFQSSQELFNKLGPEGTKKIFLWVPKRKYQAYPDGKKDNTHFRMYGAETIAGLVVDGLKKLNLPLDKDLKPINIKNLVGNGKVVGLDYFFNHEYRKNKAGKEVRYHYTWEDKANTGYSDVGNMILNLGARLSELKTAPTLKALDKFSIYIIVDPDIPKETAHPNYIEPNDIKAITKWVKNGGILILLGNDKGNAEFKHLNQLAEGFGIHFNENNINRVVGRKFYLGKFSHLPKHPIFEGVPQIYMKDISTLSLKNPARAILITKGNIIMAFAKYGKGGVFSVGDPWFYNEYYNNHKLPVPYSNEKAVQNLFSWLLGIAKKVKH